MSSSVLNVVCTGLFWSLEIICWIQGIFSKSGIFLLLYLYFSGICNFSLSPSTHCVTENIPDYYQFLCFLGPGNPFYFPKFYCFMLTLSWGFCGIFLVLCVHVLLWYLFLIWKTLNFDKCYFSVMSLFPPLLLVFSILIYFVRPHRRRALPNILEDRKI